jgi:hypothetical protein
MNDRFLLSLPQVSMRGNHPLERKKTNERAGHFEPELRSARVLKGRDLGGLLIRCKKQSLAATGKSET